METLQLQLLLFTDLVALAFRRREFDSNSAAVFHYGLNQLSAGSNKRIIEFGRNRYLISDSSSLKKRI